MRWNEITPSLRGIAHLATTAEDGSPRISVVMPVVDGDALVIFTRASSGKVRCLRVDPRVALVWQPAEEVYVYGTAEVVDDIDRKRAAWHRTDLPFDPTAFFGAPEDPDLVLLRIRPDRAIVMRDDGSGPRAHRWTGTAG